MLSVVAGLLSGIGGYVAAGVAAVVALLAYGWRRESKGREQARTEATARQQQHELDALKTRVEVDRETHELGDADLRAKLRRWKRD